MARDSVNPSPNGIVPFSAAGRSWRLVVSVNALCLIEASVSDAEEVAKLLSGRDASFTTVRAAFWAALQDHQPDLTLEEVGRILDHVGLVKAGTILATALIAAFPAVGDAAGRPQTARRPTLGGIGKGSSFDGSNWISRLIPSGFRRRAASI